MIEILEKSEYSKYINFYDKYKYFFPLIASVLNGTQGGYILKLKSTSLSSIFIVHKFGFCQFLKITEDDFLNELIQSIENKSIKKLININKLRVYYSEIDFANKLHELKYLSIQTGKRTRLDLNSQYFARYEDNIAKNFVFDVLNLSNLSKINSKLNIDLDSRFWDDANTCIKHSNAIVLKEASTNKHIGICYSAAVSNRFSEIDIFIHPEFRGKNYSLILLSKYLKNQKQNGLNSLWDCYSNNLPSLNLALRIGFEIKYEYDFLIINL